MTNYVKSTNFASKDALASGNPLKIVKGTEIDIELNNIATTIGSKADTTSPTFAGVPTAPTAAIGTNTTQLATTAFVLQHLYPIGSVYINAGVTTNPATLFGFGTWIAFGAGRVMVGLSGTNSLFDSLEETGGSADAVVVEHTHGVVDPGHTHAYYAFEDGSFGHLSGATSNDAAVYHNTVSNVTGITLNYSGTSGTNANLQPYITVAMWKRTA